MYRVAHILAKNRVNVSFYDTTHKSIIHLTTILQFLNLKPYLFTACRRLLTEHYSFMLRPTTSFQPDTFIIPLYELLYGYGGKFGLANTPTRMFLDSARKLENLEGTPGSSKSCPSHFLQWS